MSYCYCHAIDQYYWLALVTLVPWEGECKRYQQGVSVSNYLHLSTQCTWEENSITDCGINQWYNIMFCTIWIKYIPSIPSSSYTIIYYPSSYWHTMYLLAYVCCNARPSGRLRFKFRILNLGNKKMFKFKFKLLDPH